MANRDTRRIRNLSQRQEKQTAKDIGGHTQAGSGNARLGGGGDARKNGELRVECKYTEKNYYVLQSSELEKIKVEAIKGGLEAPVLQFAFVNSRTGRFTSYAVRPSVSLNYPVLAETTRKRLRITKDDLQRALLDNEAVRVLFTHGNRRTIYDILLWDKYLEHLEDEG